MCEKDCPLQQTIDEANNKEQHNAFVRRLINSEPIPHCGGRKGGRSGKLLRRGLAPITIPLDVSLSPQQNAQRYYKKYNKAKVAQTEAARQMALAQDELAYLESAQQSLSLAKTEEDLAEIRASELAAGGYMISASKEKRKNSRSQPLHFVSSDGFDIYVGKK